MDRALSEKSSFSRGEHGARILSDRVEVEGMAGIGSFLIMNYADHSGSAQLSSFDNCGRSGVGLVSVVAFLSPTIKPGQARSGAWGSLSHPPLDGGAVSLRLAGTGAPLESEVRR